MLSRHYILTNNMRKCERSRSLTKMSTNIRDAELKFKHNDQSDDLPLKPITCYYSSSIKNLANQIVGYIFKAQKAEPIQLSNGAVRSVSGSLQEGVNKKQRCASFISSFR